jgi:integrase
MPAEPNYSVAIFERPDSPFWWAVAYIDGKKQRWSTGVRVDDGPRRESRRRGEAAAEDEARRRRDIDTAQAAERSDASLRRLTGRLTAQKIADGRKPRAVETLAANITKHVLPYFGATRDVRTIRRADLEAFKRSLHEAGKKPVTINNCLSGIRQLLKLAHSEELIDAVPEVRNVFVSAESKGRALTDEELTALIDSVDPRAVEARQYLLFVANTGMRKGEANAIRWGWIDWEARVIRLPGELRKNRRGAAVPLNDVALAILDWRREHATKRVGAAVRKLPTGANDRVWLQVKHDQARNSAAARAGLGHVRTHDLRHTFGTQAYVGGASVPEVRDLLGHSTMAMANRYAHSFAPRLVEAAQRTQLGSAALASVTKNVTKHGHDPDRSEEKKARPRGEDTVSKLRK